MTPARNPRAIVTRCGVPAYVNPPAPVRASVTMADWCAQHEAERTETPPKPILPRIGLALVLAVLVVAWSGVAV